LNWSNKLLTISGPTLPGGKLEVLYPEAFCHRGSTEREWGKTTLRHKTQLVAAEPNYLRFHTSIEPEVVMLHEVRVVSNGIDLQFTLNNGLIGCFSADDKQLLATASSATHELFEGVFVCLHSDPHVGGLAPGESKEIRAKIYLMQNDPQKLLLCYRQDFPVKAR